MDVKLAASIPVSFSAMQQRIALPANAIIAEEVRAVTLAIRMGVCRRFWTSFWKQLEIDTYCFGPLLFRS